MLSFTVLPLQKELEKTVQRAAEANKKAEEAESLFIVAQSTAHQLRHEAMQKRHAVEQAEMEAATKVSMAEYARQKTRDQHEVVFSSSASTLSTVPKRQSFDQQDGGEQFDANYSGMLSDNFSFKQEHASTSLQSMSNGTGIMTSSGWGAKGSKPGAAAGGSAGSFDGIPSPGNSVHGDEVDPSNPFSF